MDEEAILEKAVQRAIKNGWKLASLVPRAWYFKEAQPGHVFYTGYDFIFNHNFNAYLWGTETINPRGPLPGTVLFEYDVDSGEERERIYTHDDLKRDRIINPSGFIPLWQYRLQQMVIADDPIKYIGENL